MTDEIIKQVDKNALNALKVAAAENDHVKQAVKTATALKLVAKSSELEKQKFDQNLATKKHELDADKTKFDQEMATKKQTLEEEKTKFDQDMAIKKQTLEEEKTRLQNELERQKRLDMIHQREAQEALEEANRISAEKQLMTRLIAESIGGIAKAAGVFATVVYGLEYEEHKVVAGKFKDLVIKQIPNPFRKG